MSTSMLCRVCVSEQSELLNMLNLYYGSTPATTFIMDILQIKVDSEGSSALVMCSSCNTILNNFYSFYNMVRDAQHKYNQIKVQDGMTREISFIDIEPHTSDFIDCKVEVEYMIDEQDDIMEYEDHEENLTAHSETSANETTEPYLIAIVSAPEDELSKVEKSESVKNSKKTKKLISDSKKITPVVKRKNIPRSQKATIAVFEKYKVEDIYSNRKWNLSQTEKDEMFKLYIDMKCTKCGKEFSTYNKLDEHCVTKHDSHALVTCDNFSLPSYEHMERHILYKHILNRRMPRVRMKIPCSVCNRLVRDCNMRLHLATHLPHDKREFQCDQCHAGFGAKGALNAHILTNHPSAAVPCNECGKLFKNSYRVKQHVQRVHSGSDNEHLCPECGKKYKDLVTFTNHVNAHYGIVERVKCSICESVIRRSCLSAHMRSHDEKNQKQCPHCPYKGFRIWEHVKRTHMKYKPFTCQLCPKTFYTDNNLKDHVAACHTGIPEHTCEFCGAKFNSSGNCHSHRKKMHPTNWALQKLEKKKKLNSGDIPVCDRKSLFRNKIVEGPEAEQIIQNLQKTKRKFKKKEMTISDELVETVVDDGDCFVNK